MAISSKQFDLIRTLVQAESALLLEPGKEYLVELRLNELANQEGLTSINDLLRHFCADPSGEFGRKIVEAMLTSETTFFRDVRPFAFLKSTVLPDLVARRATDHSLNLWCAASSGGQEPYSIAMLLRECFPQLAQWNVRLIASDLSRDLLGRAREGKFTQLEVNRGLPATFLVRYFRKCGPDWQIQKEIRNMVDFQEINLAKPWPALPRLDVIFMRNVLIYLDSESRKQILGRVRRVLKPDGYLFLGSSESMINMNEGFEPIAADVNACFRLRESMQSVHH